MKLFRHVTFLAVLGVMISCESEQRNVEGKTEGTGEEIENRVRPASSGGTSAAYFSYINSLDNADTLIAVNSEIAGLTQVHEAYETEDGMMGMREQKQVIVASGEEIIFEQGGLHIMLMRLEQDLKEGDSVRVDLEFARAGMVSKMLPVNP
ncbi:MAG: copper chaperone PCu(A)C [Gracilimonas sp.]